MTTRRPHRLAGSAAAGLLLAAALWLAPAAPAAAQVPAPSSERPGGAFSNPLDRPRDLTGRSVKTPRVRALHSTDGRVPGTTGWLIREDPWLAYQRGRELCLREFCRADGAFGETGKLAGRVLDDEATPRASRDHVNSCATCHNVPWRDMGAGATISKNAGSGRNTPHLFGAGAVEMIGQEIRRQLLARADANGDGWISRAEARGRAEVEASPGVTLDFGRFDDGDGDGRPDLDPVVYVWYVDGQGRWLSWARSAAEEGVAGYAFEVQVFGHGERDRVGHGGVSSTLRAFAASAYDLHSGLQAHDPTLNEDRVSLPGAQQFPTGHTRDLGQVTGPGGISLDDPDRDGVCEEISEGDLDLAEFFQLNHPEPAQRDRGRFREGREAAERIGCLECHTPNWRLPADRRFFRLEVKDTPAGLQGKVHVLSPRERRTPFTVEGVFSDFRHHDLGPAFHEVQFDGSTQARFRTTPLWGVGSSAPYGHDGASLSLDEAVRRHGGEAADSADRYARLPEGERRALLDFLEGLVLYSTETLPADLDGDGRIAEDFQVAGRSVGRECFNPEWLFRHPVCIEGPVEAPDGRTVVSRAALNLEEAYGMDLPGLADADRDGFPDLLAAGDGPPSEDADLQAAAEEYRRLREVRGHFEGGEWNDDVDRWKGRKHVVMEELGEALGRPGTPAGRVEKVMGPPDEEAREGSFPWAAVRPREGVTCLLVYRWRGNHDFLYFACRGDEVLSSGWWMALE